MPILYRGMLRDTDTGLPKKGNKTGEELGVRDVDVVTYQKDGQLWVAPDNDGAPQGMSVSPFSGCRLPRHRRPSGPPWNGTRKPKKEPFIVWQIDSEVFARNQLIYQSDPKRPDDHGFVSPAEAMPLDQYRVLVQSTDALWTAAPPPDPECGATSGDLPVSTSEDRVARIDAVAAGADSDALVEQLRTANLAGVGRDVIIAELEAGVARADAADNEDGAEALRTLLDRIHGFSGPHAHIDLVQ